MVTAKAKIPRTMPPIILPVPKRTTVFQIKKTENPTASKIKKPVIKRTLSRGFLLQRASIISRMIIPNSSKISSIAIFLSPLSPVKRLRLCRSDDASGQH